MIVKKLEELSQKIWIDIKLSAHYKTIYGEETISDLALLDLAKLNLPNIKIVQTSKPDEAVQGTDWEWFVGSDKLGWIRLVMQAKKLNFKSHRYNSLKHKVGKGQDTILQSGLLRKYARSLGAVPFYTFYNHFPGAKKAHHWHCQDPFRMESLGWTCTPLKNIENIISSSEKGTRNFDKIHRMADTIPISSLFSSAEFKKAITEPTGAGNLFGEPFFKQPTLPAEFMLDHFQEAPSTKLTGRYALNDFGLYPKRLAIFELNEDILI